MVVRYPSEGTRLRRWARERRAGRGASGIVRALVVAAVVVPGLAACAPDGPPPPHVTRARTEPVRVSPQVGDCWDERDYGAAVDWAWWRGGGPVDCAGEHTSVTIAVGELPADFAYQPADGTLPLADEQVAGIRAVCEPPEWQGIGLREGSRVTGSYYLPTPKQWSEGARWVRCDVVLAALGPLHPMTPEPLPGDLETLRAGISGAYRLCLDTPHPAAVYGPWYDPEGVVAASCEGHTQWEFGARVVVPDGPYPGSDALKAAALPACQAAVDAKAGPRFSGTLVLPDESGWATGRRSVICWLS